MIPVVTYFLGDIIPTVGLADEQWTVEQLAAELAVHAVGRRVAPRDERIQVTFDGNELDPQATVSGAGIGPLDAVYLAYSGEG